MTEALLAALADWGVPALALVTFLSCLALPVPASLVMMAAGAFAATGGLALPAVMAGALAGAVLGDQAGFALGRAARAALTPRSGGRARLMARARALLDRRGVAAVFLSRWLFSPLGPYVNLLAGAARMGWARFTLASVMGEGVWVGLYVGLGAVFADRFAALAQVLGNVAGLASSALIAFLALAFLRRSASRPEPRP